MGCNKKGYTLCGECDTCNNRSVYGSVYRDTYMGIVGENGQLTDTDPKKVFARWTKIARFKCDYEEGCTYDKGICSNIKNECGCPIHPKIEYNKSFASHPKSAPEHFLGIIKNNKLVKIDPKYIPLHSHKIGKFKCCRDTHTWETRIGDITNKNRPRWSPYPCCCDQTRKVCGECNDCNIRSFASHPKSVPEHFLGIINEKDELVKLDPKTIPLGSGDIGRFKCCRDSHTWETQICSITHRKSPSWSPFLCCNKQGYAQKLCGECNDCLLRSFKSIPQSEWVVDKSIDLSTIALNSDKKTEFKCTKCNHKWKTSYSSISRGSGCPNCVYKTQKLVMQWIRENYPDALVEREKKFSFSKNRRYDIYIEIIDNGKTYRFIIEVDGPQHFYPHKHFNKDKSFTDIRDIDIQKMEWLYKKNISLIRLHQNDVLADKIEWKEFLQQHLNPYEYFYAFALSNWEDDYYWVDEWINE